MTTSTQISPAQKVTVLKHSIAKRDTTFITTVTRLTVEQIRQIQQSHGYPHDDKMRSAITSLEKKIDSENVIEGPTYVPPRPSSRTDTISATTAPADAVMVLINRAKDHQSKRIQNAANRIFDNLDHLRTLLAEDEKKNAAARAAKLAKEAERRKLNAERDAAMAEVARLEAQLREAKSKLKAPSKAHTTSTATTDAGGTSAKDVRAWASTKGIACPSRGVIPQSVRDAYALAHPEEPR